MIHADNKPIKMLMPVERMEVFRGFAREQLRLLEASEEPALKALIPECKEIIRKWDEKIGEVG